MVGGPGDQWQEVGMACIPAHLEFCGVPHFVLSQWVGNS
jgi:hypothetical protein